MAKPSKMVKEWFIFAGRDLRAAKALRELGADYSNIVAFNCQQCVEKAIKGYLIFNRVRPPKTHSIGDLAVMVGAFDEKLSKELMKADKLTDYAVAYRYPDASKETMTSAKADGALKMAGKIHDALLARIQDY